MSTEQFQTLIQQAKQLSANERKQLMEYLVEAEREDISWYDEGPTPGIDRPQFISTSQGDLTWRNL